MVIEVPTPSEKRSRQGKVYLLGCKEFVRKSEINLRLHCTTTGEPASMRASTQAGKKSIALKNNK